jgi:hypothetical protein
MFLIKITDCLNEYKENSGVIKINNFSEELSVPQKYWKKKMYYIHWKLEVEKILNMGRKAALITAMIDPKNANFLNAWVLYREESNIYVQNSLIILKNFKNSFNMENIDDFISDRKTVDIDGDFISEWKITLNDLRVFYTYLSEIEDSSTYG